MLDLVDVGILVKGSDMTALVPQFLGFGSSATPSWEMKRWEAGL